VKIKDFSIYFYFGGMPSALLVPACFTSWGASDLHPKDFCFELVPLPKILDPPLQPDSKQSLNTFELVAHAE